MKKIILIILAIALNISVEAQQRFDLSSNLNTTKVCKNPHKGLYHHYYDNQSGGYLGSTAAIDALPGCDILFIRLAWRFFEPTENNYDWSLIDNLVSTYQPKGYKFGFAFTCKESGEQYATPQWVQAAGAQGSNVDCWGTTVWEPDYGDPIFLAKLQKFHAAVAARYNSAPWLAFVQIASYGTWGEGHNYPASNNVYPWTALKKHVDMYTSLYTNPKTKICWVDDAYFQQPAPDKATLKSYCESKGIFWSDHSIQVPYYLTTYPSTYSIESPALFTGTWQTRPTQLEMQHYGMVKSDGNWTVPNGTTKGAFTEIEAVKLSHCTWFGFHGDAATWVADNPIFSKQISNLVGYWYKLNYADIPQAVAAGSNQTITLNIENIGVAPAYNQYQALVKLTNGTTSSTITIDNSNNKAWMPGINNQNYTITIPSSFANGTYDVYFKMYDNIDTKRNIDMALNDAIKDAYGFFKIGTISLGGTTPPLPTSTNVLLNPGFEDGGVATQTPPSWSESNTVAASYTETNGGGHGGSFHGTHWAASSYTAYTSQIRTGLVNGTYTAKAWVKGGSGQTSKVMLVKNFGGTQMTVTIPATSTWTEITISNINVTNGQCEFGFWSSAAANQWIFFDDASLTKNATARVAMNINTAKNTDQSIMVYPSPLMQGNRLNFDVKKAKATVAIYDTEGKLVLKENVEGSGSLNTEQLSKGLYILKAKMGSRIYINKFIVN